LSVWVNKVFSTIFLHIEVWVWDAVLLKSASYFIGYTIHFRNDLFPILSTVTRIVGFSSFAITFVIPLDILLILMVIIYFTQDR